MNRLLGYGNPRTAPIQLGEGAPNFPADVHEDSARFSLHSGDRVENTTDSIWSVRELVNISPAETPSLAEDSLSLASEDPRIRRDFSSNVNTDEENSMDFQPRHFMPSSVLSLPAIYSHN
eukprot:00253.XXX_1991_2415_1 [CDS] Oithona nana genome sequencing.